MRSSANVIMIKARSANMAPVPQCGASLDRTNKKYQKTAKMR
jgi:hypothetical protein